MRQLAVWIRSQPQTLKYVVFFCFCFALVQLSFLLTPARASLDALSTCYSITATKNDVSTTCLRTTVERLLEKYPSKDVMQYITSSTTPEYIILSCHPIGHIVGEFTYKNSTTLESALSQCSNLCRSACTHGAIGAAVLQEMGTEYEGEEVQHMDAEQLRALGGKYCDVSNPTCHAVGHLAYIATTDLAEALDICDDVSTGWLREGCFQGVFMERVGAFQNQLFVSSVDDRPLEPHYGDYTYPCVGLEDRYQPSCFLLLHESLEPLFEHDGIQDAKARYEKMKHVCEGLPLSERDYCFIGFGASSRLYGFPDLFDRAKTQEICSALSTERDKKACTLGILSRFVYIDMRGSYQYCEEIPNDSRKTLCYDATFQWSDPIKQAWGDVQLMCGSDEVCRARYESYNERKKTLPNYRYRLF